jgi:pimeloyl-ACP methyl ester carboxylesterase
MRALVTTLALTVSLLTACASTSSGTVEDSYVQTADGTLLAYRKLGAGDDVLIVPGDNWIGRDIERLARGRTVIFYDGRGRGRSEARGTTHIQQDLEDLEAVRAWFGAERVSLLGMDYQGALIAFYAARHPERVDKLVIVSPIPARKFPHWKIYYQLFNERRHEDTLAELNEMKQQGVQMRDPELWGATYARMIVESWVKDRRSVGAMKSRPYSGANNDPEALVVRYFEMLRSLEDWDWRADLSSIQTPTLVVYGDSDPMPATASREWVQSMPRASEARIKNSGRMPWIERPGDFTSAVSAFLKR